MTDKIVLGSIASFQNDATAVTQYNANNALITTALNNTLSRDGTSPNQLNAALDLNGNVILNGATTGFIAANLPFTPTGNVSSTNVQSAIAELDTEKAAIANLANVAFSGTGADILTNSITWTPTITFATPGDLAVSYTTRIGKYYQLSSNLILVYFNVLSSSFTYTTASGNLLISGLPFTAQNFTGLNVRGYTTHGGVNKVGYTSIGSALPPNTSSIAFTASGMGVAPAAVTATDVPSAGTISLISQLIIFL